MFVLRPCLWKREVELEETIRYGNPSEEPKDDAKQKMLACGSWRRRTLAVLVFVPFAATVALTVHLIRERQFPSFPNPLLFQIPSV